MLTPRKSDAYIEVSVRRFASGRRLGGFLQSGIFLAALPLAMAWLLMAPARTMAQQDLYMTNTTSTVYQFVPTADPTALWTQNTYATGSSTPSYGVGLDSAGNLYVSSSGAGDLDYVLPGQTLPVTAKTVVNPQTMSYAYGMAVDSSGNVYIANQASAGTDTVTKYTVFSMSPTNTMNSQTKEGAEYISQSGLIPAPGGGQPYQDFDSLAIDPSGNLWVGIINANGTTAGSGGVEEWSISGASPSMIGSPYIGTIIGANGIAFDAASNMYVADSTGNTVWEYAYSSSTQTYATPTPLITSLTGPQGIVITAGGDLIVGTKGGTIDEFSLTGTPIDTIATGDGNVAFLALSVVSTPAWTGGASDNMWMVGDTANWSNGVVPGNTSGSASAGYTDTDTALFNQADGGFDPTIIQSNLNVMNITFDNSGGLLTSTITIGTTGGLPLLLTSGGTIQTTASVANPQVVDAPLVLEGNYTFTSGATLSTATLSFGGGITSGAASGTTTLTLNGSNTGPNTISGVLADGTVGSNLAVAVSGTGVWVLNGATSTYTGGTTIASGATLELAGSVSALSQTMNVVNSGSLLVTGGNQTLGKLTGTGSVSVTSGSLTAYQIVQNSLTIAAGATVTLVPSGSGSTTNPTGPNNINFSSTLTSLSIAGSTGAWTGTLDIGNNGLVIAYGSAADPYSTIDNMIETGFDSAHWDGQGITSSLGRAAAESHTPLNIGLLDFTPGTGIYSQTTFIVFAGQTVTTNAILIRLTYMDDVNMYGDMSAQHAASDALTFAANYGSGTTWSVGDLTHQGLVGSAAALLFASNYATGLASLDGTSGGDVVLGGSAAAVPEPASALLAALGASGAALIARRGRKRRRKVASATRHARVSRRGASDCGR